MDAVAVASADSPAWALVVVSVFGVFAAGYAGYYARKIFNIEKSRDTDRLEQQERAQAVLVSAWAEMTQDTTSGIPRFGLMARAENGSGRPIYNVEIEWLVNGEKILLETTGLIPPNSPYRWDLPVGKYIEIPRQGVLGVRSYEWTLSVVKNSGILITFTDAENRQWARQLDGGIEQIRSKRRN